MTNENALDEAAERQASDEPNTGQLFPVVGIGASAGGLEALRAFLDHLPARSGMAFVVVVHLSPEHQSHLSELLQSHTRMPVIQVNELVQIEPDHVYVIPPNRNLSTIDSHLRLSALEQARAQRAPIDHFLRTLADSHGQRAIGIILSGSGSDGAVGLKRIKEAGGLIIAQDPTETAYDGMPQSAIATGLVDYTLPVAEIPGRLLAYARHEPALRIPEDEDALGDEERAILHKIFAQLRAVVGHDFSHYKHATVLRRIRRRMQLRGVTTLAAYLEVLRAEHAEQVALFKDLLISVTTFFREKESYDVLQREVIPQLFAGKEAGESVRVWVPGCATGEEAYSLAILLLEHAGQLDSWPEIQIFATDISKEAIAVAREGFYAAAIAADVETERLERFFNREQGGYRVREEVRKIVLFAPHSLLKEPPFSRLDLLSCRNLLIYIKRGVQRQVFELFHYALRPGGYLFLGTSESADDIDLFRAVDKKHSIYQRRNVASAERRLPSLPMSAPDLHHWQHAPDHAFGRYPMSPQPALKSYGGLHQQLVEQHAPPSALVNEDHTIVHLSQHAGRYLQHPGGEPTNNILKLVRDELRLELATLLYRAFEQKRPLRSNPIPVSLEGESCLVSLYVQPAREEDGQTFVLVFFLESEVMEGGRTHERPPGTPEALVRELEEELAATKEQLRLAIEEFEGSKEEMKAANEELLSMNEALRQSQERYRLIVEGVKEYAMLTMDEEARIDSWNQGAKRIFGYDEAEIIGKPGAIIFTEEDRQKGEVEKELKRARTEGQAINERWHVRQDGSRFWGSGVVTSLWDGKLRGYAKVMRDNTLRKEAEEQLRQSQERLQALNETLEERVRQRTEQVRALASELVISEQKVRHRISQVLHDDLQQLLYALEMQLQLYRDDVDEATLAPEGLEALNQLVDMVRTSIRLTRQLTVEISPPVLQGEGLLEALKWLATHMHEVYGLEVAVEAGDHPPRVTNEEQRILLFQVVRELLFNVVKHAGVKQARVTLQGHAGGLSIEVLDKGQGFEADKTLAARASDFGLHNVRERLQLFDGTLDIDSEPGAGARVRVFMPRQQPGATVEE